MLHFLLKFSSGNPGLYCGLSHGQLLNYHCFMTMTFLTIYHTG